MPLQHRLLAHPLFDFEGRRRLSERGRVGNGIGKTFFRSSGSFLFGENCPLGFRNQIRGERVLVESIIYGLLAFRFSGCYRIVVEFSLELGIEALQLDVGNAVVVHEIKIGHICAQYGDVIVSFRAGFQGGQF